ncbi:MAG: ATP-binding cassette domain-containing protein, partial [Clostridia bacterium]|nr:ATP-binding cassette domain-containing protein [Clostridia bacterium]
NDEGALAIKNVSFYIRGGEILGVAGIAGCGQKELCEAIAGLRPIEKGQMIHKGDNIVGLTPKQILEKGISMSFIPEDRLGMGLVGGMGMVGNMQLRNYTMRKSILAEIKHSRELAQQIREELGVVTPSLNTPVRRLSGGNVQKVLVGREIASAPAVLMTAYAVRGLDIGASYTIYNLLNKQKEKGVAVLFVGEDLDVLVALCDRILVLCDGHVNGIVDGRTTTKEEVGYLMTNLKSEGGTNHE